MIINARSPYFILVNESGQVGSKVEIFLWNKPNSVPASATYTLSKRKASATQTENTYNISSFIREYIDNVSPSESSNLMWCNVRIKRYKETSFDTYTLIDAIDYIGVNGYTKYLDGYNKTDSSTKFVVLADTSKEIQYTLGSIPSVNIAINTTLGDKIEAVYKDLNGRNSITTVLLAATDSTRKDMLKVDLSTSSVKYNCGNTITLNYYVGATLTTTKVFRVIPVCEPKYTPVVCAFINRFGGWQFLNFFKAQTNSINVEGTTYKMMPNAVNYNTSRPQSSGFNINGSQSLVLNTGWVKENYSDLIQDLLLAETILLDGKPAECKTTSTNLKTSLMDRNINYTIEFEYAYNLINNVI
ncbi:hypothetical protein UFOVP324_12 [uncultured Caudovirales phage]|uniref:Uncharacterized protein n=1 Tax=uncultured Caudovirales phage TaxID=2100421 RepID=A0A6J5LVM6_9CAUD|nr:hypothetical protein UFOVP324_12 [uncultured Caudovirales phage]